MKREALQSLADAVFELEYRQPLDEEKPTALSNWEDIRSVIVRNRAVWKLDEKYADGTLRTHEGIADLARKVKDVRSAAAQSSGNVLPMALTDLQAVSNAVFEKIHGKSPDLRNLEQRQQLQTFQGVVLNNLDEWKLADRHAEGKLMESSVIAELAEKVKKHLGLSPRPGVMKDLVTDRLSLIKEVVREAWRAPYKGEDTATYFLKYIDDYLGTSKRYSNSVAIVQSSGTGKSRLLDQVARQRFTFTLCTRANDPEGNTSWPPPDAQVRDFFKQAKQYPRMAVKVFLTSLFEHATVELGKAPLNDFSTGELPQQWRLIRQPHSNDTTSDDQLPGRKDFYDAVTEAAIKRRDDYVKVLENMYETTHSPRLQDQQAKKLQKEIDDKLMSTVDSMMGRLQGVEPSRNRQKEPTIEDVQEGISQMQVSDCALSSGGVRVIVSIDEAHEIKNILPAITSVFHDLSAKPVMAVYLSTTSFMSELAPTKADIDSGRAGTDVELSRPFTALPMDLHSAFGIDSSLRMEDMKLCDIRSVEKMVTLGRIMWSAHLHTKAGTIDQLYSLAESKLLRTNEVGPKAVLCVRLALGTDHSHAGRELAAKLVASHLRVAFMASKDRATIRTGYPPEPVVGAAAAGLMCKNSPAHSSVSESAAPGILMEMMASEAVGTGDRGDRGETVSRFVIIRARDRAWMDMYAKVSNPGLQMAQSVLRNHEPVRLKGFLEHLLGRDGWNKVRNCLPVNVAGVPFGDFFGTAMVDFVAFGHVEDTTAFTYPGLVRLLIQGLGAILKSCQAYYDLLLVVVLDPKKPLTEENFAIIAISVKNTKERLTTVILPDSPIGGKIPFISIVHQIAQPFEVDVHKVAERRSERGSKVEPKPHYRINLYGIPGELLDAEIAEEMLDARTFMMDIKDLSLGLQADAERFVRRQKVYALSRDGASDSWASGLKCALSANMVYVSSEGRRVASKHTSGDNTSGDSEGSGAE